MQTQKFEQGQKVSVTLTKFKGKNGITISAHDGEVLGKSPDHEDPDVYSVRVKRKGVMDIHASRMRMEGEENALTEAMRSCAAKKH